MMNAGQNMSVDDRADTTIQTVGLMMAGVVDSDVEARR